MSRPVPPALTVRYEGSERTFAAGNDVVIGRDLRADVRVAHPLISRTHLIVRYDQGRWLAIDNGSLNGLYVNNRRVSMVDIQDGLRVNIGNPDGPALTFEVGRHTGTAGMPPPTTSIPIVNTPNGPVARVPQGQPSGPQWPAPPQQSPAGQQAPSSRHPVHPPTGGLGGPPSGPLPIQQPGPQPRYPTSGHPVGPPSGPQSAPQIYRTPPANVPPATAAEPAALETGRVGADSSVIATSMMKILRPGKAALESTPGAIRIGRANDNDIVIPEVLASRHHATLIPSPAGTEIRDAHSVNGTFVNGVRVGSAVLTEGDVVTGGDRTSARAVAEAVTDPELPMLTLADLGVLREVKEDGDAVTVSITPTYSGCPALDIMRDDLVHALRRAGYGAVEVRTVLALIQGVFVLALATRSQAMLDATAKTLRLLVSGTAATS